MRTPKEGWICGVEVGAWISEEASMMTTLKALPGIPIAKPEM
jgi:hypothetical protein